MKSISKLVGVVCSLWAASLMAQSEGSPTTLSDTQRTDYVSTASFVVGTYDVGEVKHDPEAMAKAATAFLNELSDQQREAANLDLKDRERREWTNLPAPRNAGGVRLGDLNKSQLQLACKLMATLFSEQGYRKVRDIMLADDQLLRGGRPRAGFGTENFSLVIFGTPSPTEPWAFQVDGHHVGVNLAMKGNQLTMSPSFIGTQPHQFKIAKHSIQPFAKETGLAYKLLGSFDDDQIRAAVLGDQRGRIVTGPGTDGKVPQTQGMLCSKLNEAQKDVLLELIAQWVNDLPEPHAAQRMKEIEAEINEMRVSWNGQKKPGSDISYRIQSPSLIIEYACQDLGGNPIDHLHSMYRNPKNEYGKQLD